MQFQDVINCFRIGVLHFVPTMLKKWNMHPACSHSFMGLWVHQRPIPHCCGILSFRRSTSTITRASSFPSRELLKSRLTSLAFVSQSCTFLAKTVSVSPSRVIPSNMRDTSLPINLYELILYSISRIKGISWRILDWRSR